jgi:hypothetical protein
VSAPPARRAGAADQACTGIRGEPARKASRDGRRAWLREAKERLERERAESPEPVARERQKRLESCHRRLVVDWRAERQASQAYEAYRARGVMSDGRRFGVRPQPYTPPAKPEKKINTTDPDSKNMKGFRGYVQG